MCKGCNFDFNAGGVALIVLGVLSPSGEAQAPPRFGNKPIYAKVEQNGRIITDKNGCTITTDNDGKVTVLDKDGNSVLNTAKSEYRSVTDKGMTVVVDKIGNTYTADQAGRIIITNRSGQVINSMPKAGPAAGVKGRPNIGAGRNNPGNQPGENNGDNNNRDDGNRNNNNGNN